MRAIVKWVVFWLLIGVFVALSIWWTCTFPYDAALVYRTVPPEASVVTEHENLAQRWRSMVGHPVVVGLLEEIGVPPGELRGFARDPGVLGLIDRFAARHTLLAYVPASGSRGEPMLVLSSWMGFDGQLMRWGFYNRALKSWQRFRLPDGTRVWSLPCSGSLHGYALSLAVFEGVLVGALSRDARAAGFLRRRLEWGAEGVPFLSRGAREVGRDAIAEPPDRGWLTVVGGAAQPVRFSLNGWDEDALTARMACNAFWRPVGTAAVESVAALRPLLQGRAAAAALLSWEDLALLLSAGWMPPDVRRVGEIVADMFPGETPAFVCMNTGDYSGRVLGLRIPSVMIGIRFEGDLAPLDRLKDTLDRLNAESTWGLIPRAQAGAGVFSIESTRSPSVPLVGDQEKPALGQCGGWLILSSSGQVLNRFVAECEPVPRAAVGVPPFDFEGAGFENGASALLWVEGRRAGPALASLMAAYELSLMARNAPQSSAARGNLRRIEPWLDALSKIGPVDAIVRPPEGETMRVDMRLRVGARK